jgi:hypothetical protein
MIVQVQRRSFFQTYLKLGYLLHLMTIAEIALIIGCFLQFELIKWAQDEYVFLKSVFLFAFVCAPIFPQCDARSRYQNYKQVKDHLYLYGFQPRIIKPFSFSRCQRDAVIAAAEELGMEKQCIQYFIDQGHRWYHLLPDFLYHKPEYLFQRAFWLNTFFAKQYHSKVDFSFILKKHPTNLSKKEQYHFIEGSII